MIPYNKNLVKNAKALRKQMTREEKKLWYDFLAKYTVRFQRQKAIDHFIADFYCHEARLIVEIDGAQHYADAEAQKDEFRTEVLAGYGLRVIRFTNRQINTNFQGVCAYIDAVVRDSCIPSVD